MKKPPTASAPPADFNIPNPTPTAGYMKPGHPMPNPGSPGFMPREGEGNPAARMRVLDTVREIAAANGQSPAEND